MMAWHVRPSQGQHVCLQAAGLAADNLMCALYFTTLFSLAKGIPPDAQAEAQADADVPAADSALPGKPSVQVREASGRLPGQGLHAHGEGPA